MKNTFTSPILLHFAFAAILFGMPAILLSQNIFSGEPVQVVGQFNAYAVNPYNSDYRTTAYRTISTTGGNPTDGRGQWATTIQVPGGDVFNTNMTGGGGAGFLFISGPSGNRFQNKWAFSGIAQGTLNAINDITAFNSGQDMGLNMNTSGYYTFVFNDAGYTLTNAKYYVGFTAASPVSINTVSATPNEGGSATINITTSASLSAQEKIYVRYTTGPDFSGTGSSSLVQVSMTGTSGTATIPSFPFGQTVRYYVFSSTRSLVQLNANSETDRTLATLRYYDNGGNNDSYVALPIELTAFTAEAKDKTAVLSWSTATEHNNAYFEIQRSVDSREWVKIGTLAGKGTTLQQQTYQFTDQQPPSGINYYRLKQVDFDGTSSLSNIRNVTIGKSSSTFSLYPNPATSDEVYVEFPEMSEDAYVRLFDLQGRLLREWNLEAEGNARFRLDLSGLPKSNLFLQVNRQDCKILLR